jgi:hypothetical protein
MPTPADIIATYIRAKDSNRPHLLRAAFAETAELEMIVKSDAISFPPRSVGRAAIEDVLVRQFGQTFENVYTFCLATPPAGAGAFHCGWLVGMSEKVGGAVRVGFGTYDWQFQAADPCLARRLLITVEKMEVMPPERLLPVMEWMSSLPYPWCRTDVAITTAPVLEPLSRILALLRGPSTN